jgi:aminoglycoside/choline kinase family phosphotransferase
MNVLAQDPRAGVVRAWLQTLSRGDAPFTPPELLAADASFRRYFRTQRADRSYVIMDAPPERENLRPYLQVTALLHELGLRAPRVIAQDFPSGLLLLEDLGDLTFSRALQKGIDENSLYRLAGLTLRDLQTRWLDAAPSSEWREGLPSYSMALLLQELRLFLDWYWPARHGCGPDPQAQETFLETWTRTLDELPALPDVLVLRDFHVDNLMLLTENGGPAAEAQCGLLDFQDAVLGSPAYDLVSLLEDARRDVSDTVQKQELERYLAAMPFPRSDFLTHYRVLGVQRTLKIMGIFTRLEHRDRKPTYQRHQPRLRGLLARGLQFPELVGIRAWFDEYFPNENDPCMP